MKKAVVALNGFLGDRRNILDIGEMVNTHASLSQIPYYQRRRGGAAHGGWNIISKKRIRRWIQSKVDDGYEMVFAGKSFGAWWVLDFFDEGIVGEGATAFLLDPAHNLSRAENKTRSVPGSENIVVIRQEGHRSGYSVTGATEHIVDATHCDIERSELVYRELRKFLEGHGLC